DDIDAPHLHARRDLLALEVREADEADLPILHELVEGAHRLLERDGAVRPVHEIDVDVVGAEVLEGLVDRGEGSLPAAVPKVRLVAVVHPELADDDRLVPPASERLAEGSFRRTHAVPLGRVEAVDAEVERPPYRPGKL